MGLSDDYRLPERYNDAYHVCGDGCLVPVVRHIAAHLLEPLLRANGASGLVAAPNRPRHFVEERPLTAYSGRLESTWQLAEPRRGQSEYHRSFRLETLGFDRYDAARDLHRQPGPDQPVAANIAQTRIKCSENSGSLRS